MDQELKGYDDANDLREFIWDSQGELTFFNVGGSVSLTQQVEDCVGDWDFDVEAIVDDIMELGNATPDDKYIWLPTKEFHSICQRHDSESDE